MTPNNPLYLLFRCKFVPGRGVDCNGGVSDLIFDDGSRRLLEIAQEMEKTFVTYDAAGNPISPAHRFLMNECTAQFDVENDCEGGCSGCKGKTTKAKCLARLGACKGKSIEGLSLPFLSDPFSVVGLLSGKDIQIVDFT